MIDCDVGDGLERVSVEVLDGEAAGSPDLEQHRQADRDAADEIGLRQCDVLAGVAHLDEDTLGAIGLVSVVDVTMNPGMSRSART